MENIQDAKYYAKKIAEESRHKFIYTYNDNRKLLVQHIKEAYPVLFGNDHSAIYLPIEGLPRVETSNSDLNKTAISIMCHEYLSFTCASKLLQSIIDNNDAVRIKQTEKTLLNYINYSLPSGNINSLTNLFAILKETKEMYLEIYLDYLQRGILADPVGKSPICFLELEGFVHFTKQMLGKSKHISFVLDHEQEICLNSYKAINNLLGARINGDISVNILSEPDAWKTYLDQQGQLIEATHDYEDVEYDESSSEYLVKMKKKYQIN